MVQEIGKMKTVSLADLAYEVREIMTRIHNKSPHSGSSFSMVEIMTALFFDQMRGWASKDDCRDAFILSKGHGVGCLYAVLNKLGLLKDDHLTSFATEGASLFSHPVRGSTPEISVSTGSLGHGLAIGIGIAFSETLRAGDRRIYVVMGDGECQEGSVWEAAWIASHLRLNNLTIVVDNNGLQDTCRNFDVRSVGSLPVIWQSFGWDVDTVDGHSFAELQMALQKQSNMPRVIIARTTKGKGILSVEGTIESHHHILTEEDISLIRRVSEPELLS